MKIALCAPTPSGQPKYQSLRWTTEHPSSSHGLGVLLPKRGSDVYDGKKFLVDVAAGAWIETDNPERVIRALGLPSDQHGHIKLWWFWRTNRLRDLMAAHNLNAPQTAKLLSSATNTAISAQLVRGWAAQSKANNVPAETLALLECLLEGNEGD